MLEHVPTLFSSNQPAVAAHFGGHPRAVGRNYAKQIGEADAEHTSRRSLFQIVQGVFVAKSGVSAVYEF